MKMKPESCLGDDVWPPGFRFHPTDEELVLYYLKRKICGKKLKLDIIRETDVYKWEPEELPAQSILKTGDRQWFFFSPRDRKYPNGGRSNRATRNGYWKATGKDRSIACNSRTVGVKKTLVFYRGRAPSGERTDWVMHEYTVDEEELKRCQNVQEYYALYKVYKKSGPGPKNGEQYGAPFKEEDWLDDECPDFNNSTDRDISVKQLTEVTSVTDVRVNDQVPSTFDEFEEFMRRIADEPVLDQPQINNSAHTLSQVGEEETQSTMVDPYPKEVITAEPIRVLHPSGQQYDVQASFGYTQSATSQLQLYETPEITSAPNLHKPEPLIIQEEDFLEIDDLIGPEPSFSDNDRAVENLQFEEPDGLSEFDLYHDAAMFIHDMGPISQAIADPYMNILENNTLNQFDYQLQPNLDGTGQIENQLWTHDFGRNINTSAESNLRPSGVVYESTNLPTEENQNQNQNGNEGGGAAGRFSSALWSFVESIPTTPASAAENVLVNRAFERMSSFSRLRVNVKSTTASAPNSTETIRRAGISKGFLFISVIGLLCAILCALIGTVRLWGWTAYLISILYVEYRTRKEREKVDFRNHVIQWFEVLDGLLGKHWRNAGLFFNCTFLMFGSVIQLIACASNIYYINDNLDKRTWTYIFGACCATTVFIPSFHNYRIWSFLGLIMTTYTAWYLTIASLIHGQVEGVTHSGPTKIVLYFTGATNILYTFGGHAVTVEIMHAMWKPQKFKLIYLIATLYVLTLTLPSASAVYWAFGDTLLTHSNAISLLPRTGYRDTAVVLMLIHQFITFGFACTPLYFVWEKFLSMHETKSMLKRALARLPVVIPIWFLAIIFPFFGPINSAVGSLLVSFTVYIIPAMAHMVTFASASARENAVERPPSFIGGWAGLYTVNVFVVVWVLIVGFGFGGWASMLNFIRQVDTFGLFTKCYQCPPHKA